MINMITNRVVYHLILLIGLFFTSTALSVYNIHIIVFDNSNINLSSEKLPLAYPKFPNLKAISSDHWPSCSASANHSEHFTQKLEQHNHKIHLNQCIQISDKELSSTKTILFRSYEPLKHNENITHAFLSMFNHTDPQVIGSMSLRKSSFIEFVLDIVFSKPSRTQDAFFVLSKISEKRKIKLREVNYFDHPLFGVLVYIA